MPVDGVKMITISMCKRCGGRTTAADGSCNNALTHDMKRGGVPLFCMSTEFEDVEIPESVKNYV